jgi:hypothetical protein
VAASSDLKRRAVALLLLLLDVQAAALLLPSTRCGDAARPHDAMQSFEGAQDLDEEGKKPPISSQRYFGDF